jgi:hypothetical protein
MVLLPLMTIRSLYLLPGGLIPSHHDLDCYLQDMPASVLGLHPLNVHSVDYASSYRFGAYSENWHDPSMTAGVFNNFIWHRVFMFEIVPYLGQLAVGCHLFINNSHTIVGRFSLNINAVVINDFVANNCLERVRVLLTFP